VKDFNRKNQEKQKVYIDLYHHQNCEREKYLTTKILLVKNVKNEKHVIIIVKKTNILQLICEKYLTFMETDEIVYNKFIIFKK